MGLCRAIGFLRRAYGLLVRILQCVRYSGRQRQNVKGFLDTPPRHMLSRPVGGWAGVGVWGGERFWGAWDRLFRGGKAGRRASRARPAALLREPKHQPPQVANDCRRSAHRPPRLQARRAGDRCRGVAHDGVTASVAKPWWRLCSQETAAKSELSASEPLSTFARRPKPVPPSPEPGRAASPPARANGRPRARARAEPHAPVRRAACDGFRCRGGGRAGPRTHRRSATAGGSREASACSISIPGEASLTRRRGVPPRHVEGQGRAGGRWVGARRYAAAPGRRASSFDSGCSSTPMWYS